MPTPVFIRWILAVVVVVVVRSMLGCAGTGGALPQSSLPVPENDPITVSAPDSQGFVVVTGAEGAVPNSVTLVVSVDSATSQLSSANFLTFLLSTFNSVDSVANATTCSSSLPECPAVEGSSCQYAANDSGGFLFLVPATVTDVINVNYLDSESCNEVDGFAITVGSDVHYAQINAKSATLNSTDNELIIYGTVDDANTLAVFSTADISLVTTITPSTSGTPENVSLVQDASDNAHLILQSTTHTRFGSFTNNSLGSLTTLVNSSGSELSGMFFRREQEFTYPPATDVSCLSAGFLSGSSHTRVFFTDNTSLYVLDSLNNLSLNSQQASNNVVPREVTLQLTAIPDATVVDLPFVGEVGDNFVVVAGFALETAGDTHYYAVEVSADSGFCNANLDIGSDTRSVFLGIENDAVDVRAFTGINSSGETVQKIAVLKETGQSLVVIDATNMDDAQIFSVEQLADDYDDIIIEDAVDFLVLSRAGATEFDLFFIANDSGGGGFVVSDSSDNIYDNSGVNAIAPVGLVYDANNNQIIFTDAGLADDGYSNLVVVDL